MNILGMVFRREGSKLPLYGGCKVWGEFFFLAKTHFFVGNQYGEPIPIGISAIQPLVHPLTGVQSWG